MDASTISLLSETFLTPILDIKSRRYIRLFRDAEPPRWSRPFRPGSSKETCASRKGNSFISSPIKRDSASRRPWQTYVSLLTVQNVTYAHVHIGRLVIIDTVHPLISGTGTNSVHLPSYLSSLLAASDPSQAMQTSLVVIYHNDIPPPVNSAPYTPSPRSLLTYLATTIISVHPLPHILAQKAARDRSEIAPVFGLAEEVEGVLIGRPSPQAKDGENKDGIVLEMEHRRKSGRGIVEWFFLPVAKLDGPPQLKETAILLDDHPLYRREEEPSAEENQEPDSTFDLGLTERQRREREGVVLPYFDAQKGGGPGEGGRILYDMGEDDDFDEEEDEI